MVTRLLALLALGTLVGCQLDPGVVYRCNLDGGCLRAGLTCDGEFCVPTGTVGGGSGGGAMGGGGGATGGGGGGSLVEDAGLDAGTPDAGDVDAGAPDAGEQDAGVKDGGGPSDAGPKDGGLDDGGVDPCAPAEACKFSACGFTSGGASCPDVFCGYCGAGSQCGAELPNECGPSMLCEDGGWCWENLWPQGNTLRGSWVRSRREAWFVGDSATVIRFDGERFKLVPIPGLPRTVNLHAVHGNDVDLVAVGSNGTVATYRDGGWSVVNYTSNTLVGVAVMPPSLGGHTLVVGGSAAGRRVGATFSSITTTPSADFVSIAVTDGGTVRALASNGDVYAYASTPSLTRELQLNYDGVQLVASGPLFFVLGESRLADGGVQAEVGRGAGTFASGLYTPLFSVPGLDPKGLAPQGPGGAWVVGVRGELHRGASGSTVTGDLTSGIDGDGLYTIGLLEPDHPVMGGAEGKLAVCRPPCNPGDYSLLSIGTSRNMYKLCGAAPERLVVAAGSGCRAGAPTCDHRLMAYDPALPGFWDQDDVSDIPSDAGRLVACVDLGSETVAYTEYGVELRRAGPYPLEFEYTNRLQLGGVLKGATATIGTGNDFDRFVYLLSGQNRVWSLPDGGGLIDLRSVDMTDAGLPPQNDICALDWDLFTVGNAGSSAYLDRPMGNTLDWSWASSGSGDTQRALRATKLMDGGELFISAGDRGAVWYRLSPSPDGGSVRFRYSDAGVGHNLTAAWVGARGVAAVGTTRGVVLYTDPATQQWVETPTLSGTQVNDVFGLVLPDGGQRIWAVGANGVLMSRPLP